MHVTAIKNVLAAQSMERALKFYRGAFAFGILFSTEAWSELTFGISIIAFHSGHDGSENRVSLSIQVDDVMAAMDQVVRRGGTVVVPPHHREGQPIMYSEFKDTEGNIVMMTQYVG